MVKRIKMSIPLTEQVKNYPTAMIPVDAAYLPGMAEALLDAYQDTVDYEGESYEDALEELSQVLLGRYGPLMQEASWLILDNLGDVAAGVLVCLFQEEPTITYTFTRKTHRRKGYATLLLNKAQDTLYDLGYDNLSLYVTLENKEALNLYECLGFREAPLWKSSGRSPEKP